MPQFINFLIMFIVFDKCVIIMHMTKKEAQLFLEKVNQYGSIPGLDSVGELCRRLGNPQDALQFVHIAGTNGKGTVAKLVSDACTASGMKTGRYTSPALSDYRERFQIDGRMISYRLLYEYLGQLKEVCGKMEEEGLVHPTAFEMETALAFLYFKEQGCDLVVLECGMGGDLDATNIVTSTKVAVFTSISIDHTGVLGRTITEIAGHKAGILKTGAAVVCYPSCDEALQEILHRAEELQIPQGKIKITDKMLIRNIKYGLEKQSFSYRNHKKVTLALCGKYQITNAAVALDVLDTLCEAGFPLREAAVLKAFSEEKWHGRMEILAKRPLFVIDGAHNADAADKLADSVAFYFTNRKIIYIMGILRDKDYSTIIERTSMYADHIITVSTPDNPRAMGAYELAVEVNRLHGKVTVADSLTEAVEMAYLLADKDSVILAFGSLSYLGALRKIVCKRNAGKGRKPTKI